MSGENQSSESESEEQPGGLLGLIAGLSGVKTFKLNEHTPIIKRNKK